MNPPVCRVQRLATFLVSLAMTSPALIAEEKPSKPDLPKAVRATVGDRVRDIITNSERAETFRIARKAGQSKEKRIGKYLITGSGKARGKMFASQIAAVLSKEETYDSKKIYGCFNPGVAFRLFNGKDHVDVIVCFECHNLQILKDDKELFETIPSFAASPAIWRRFLQLAKESFPDDKDIQGMKDE